MVAAACASRILVARRIPYRAAGHALPTGHACHAVHGGCTAAAAPGRERSDEACKTAIGAWAAGGPPTLADGWWSRRMVVGRGTNKTTSGRTLIGSADSMSKLLDAVQQKEWEKMMVRRILEAVWYLKRM